MGIKTSYWSAVTAATLAAAAAMTAPSAVAEDDAMAAKANQCIGCHQIALYKTSYPEVYLVPKILGQNPAYIADALRQYRSGQRSHPSMNGIAGPLSDQDIEDLAAYYGKEYAAP